MGDNETSNTYINNKMKLCNELEINVIRKTFKKKYIKIYFKEEI